MRCSIGRRPAYGTRVDDLLLSALVRALQPWTGRSDVLVDVESPGRESLFNDVDLSRTIGWFTAVAPVHLEAGDGTPGAVIKATKETLRHLHHHGLSFGALRYLSSDADVRAALERVPRAELLFKYSGSLDAIVSGSALFTFAAESAGPWRADREPALASARSRRPRRRRPPQGPVALQHASPRCRDDFDRRGALRGGACASSSTTASRSRPPTGRRPTSRSPISIRRRSIG